MRYWSRTLAHIPSWLGTIHEGHAEVLLLTIQVIWHEQRIEVAPNPISPTRMAN